MEESVSHILDANDEKEVIKRIVEFNEKFSTTFGLLDLNDEYAEKLWKFLLGWLSDEGARNTHLPCITALRILSRDKEKVLKILDEDRLLFFVQLAGLSKQDQSQQHNYNQQANYKVISEALKCLSNFIMISPKVVQLCASNSTIPCIITRLKGYNNPELPFEIKITDLKILFLLSALAPQVRPTIRNDYRGLHYLIEALEVVNKQRCTNGMTSPSSPPSIVFNKEEVYLISEILKSLYNLLIDIDKSTIEEEDYNLCQRLISILRGFLLARCADDLLLLELQKHTINLLLPLPSSLYEDLLCLMPSARSAGFCGAIGGTGPEPDMVHEYDGKDMMAVHNLLLFFNCRLKEVCKKKPNLDAPLDPVLSLFIKMVGNNRTIRKFVRIRVLPPLRDVTTRPEEGSTMRNMLCSLMTSPTQEHKSLASNFLFILCKENVNRLVKYTGYGNAAGLLASRGLMLGGKSASSYNYSSDSSDSDTEEYLSIKNRLNPVTGATEPERPSPMEGMTEEQKEYETMKLVNALEKLSCKKLIQPCRIGEDGQPQPVSHILELLEGQNNQDHHNSDDD